MDVMHGKSTNLLFGINLYLACRILISEPVPKLSIITINYNNATGLQRTMQSVFEQQFTHYEYIVIDGGSTDGSRECIVRNAGKLAYWVSEKDKGIYPAMNKGITASKGDYLLFLNSGDYFAGPNVCSQLLENISTKTDIVYGNVDVVLPDLSKTQFIAPQNLTIDYMLAGTLFHPATLIRKRLFDEYGLYDERLKIVSDWAFFFKVIVSGNAACEYKNMIVSVYHKDGISSKLENQRVIKEEREKVIQANLPTVVSKLLAERDELQKQAALKDLELRSRKLLFTRLLKRLYEDATRLYKK
ncbi:MAG: glycosyltransferase [Pedobacter sp.]|nr:MAG: glycosyltransferase [Pedobacter sp.]